MNIIIEGIIFIIIALVLVVIVMKALDCLNGDK
jgi:hypothetical protein